MRIAYAYALYDFVFQTLLFLTRLLYDPPRVFQNLTGNTASVVGEVNKTATHIHGTAFEVHINNAWFWTHDAGGLTHCDVRADICAANDSLRQECFWCD
jgi:hypothetical protein